MSKRKRQARKKLGEKDRIKNAVRWLKAGGSRGKPLVQTYSKRYAVPEGTAYLELMELGYYEELCIQHYEAEGIEWEYRVEPLSGDMFVVPKNSEAHELYEIHGIL